MNAIERRLRQLEAKGKGKSTPRYYRYIWSDGEDPEPKRLEAEAEYRTKHGLPRDADLNPIGIHIVSVVWMKSQEAA